jgi:phage shock protein C
MMRPSEELARLSELHQRGVLSDEEFTRAKARVLNAEAAATGPAPFVDALNSLRRSRTDRWVGGVCAGLASLTGLAPWAWRLIFVLLLMFGGTGLLAYVLLWAFVPQDDGAGSV